MLKAEGKENQRAAQSERARRQYGLPTTIRVNQSSQFTSKEPDLWAYTNRVTLDFSHPGKSTEAIQASRLTTLRGELQWHGSVRMLRSILASGSILCT